MKSGDIAKRYELKRDDSDNPIFNREKIYKHSIQKDMDICGVELVEVATGKTVLLQKDPHKWVCEEVFELASSDARSLIGKYATAVANIRQRVLKSNARKALEEGTLDMGTNENPNEKTLENFASFIDRNRIAKDTREIKLAIKMALFDLGHPGKEYPEEIQDESRELANAYRNRMNQQRKSWQDREYTPEQIAKLKRAKEFMGKQLEEDGAHVEKMDSACIREFAQQAHGKEMPEEFSVGLLTKALFELREDKQKRT